jgi:hypothetical protein
VTKSLADNAEYINAARKAFYIEGQEVGARINWELGIAGAMKDFTDAGASRDCMVIAFAELTFMEQDLAYCEKGDKDALASLGKGRQDFADALRCLEVVKVPEHYKIAEKAFPTWYKYRIKDCPWDAYQVACEGNKLRLRNILRAPGINMKEKAVLKQRLANMDIAHDAYLELQQKALAAQGEGGK